MAVNLNSNSYSPYFIECIDCDKVAIDGYEITNLISKDFNKRLQGYMAEYFIKPPINIYIHFKRPIELSHLIIDPRVGKQSSKDFSIAICNLTSKTNPLKKIQNDRNWKYLTRTNIDPILKTYNERLCFYNPNYEPLSSKDSSLEINSLKCITHQIQANQKFNLLNRNVKSLDHVMVIKLTILNVYSASTVVINSINIYGKPSVPINSNIKSPKSLFILDILKSCVNRSIKLNMLGRKRKNNVDQDIVVLEKVKVIEDNHVLDESNVDPITYETLSDPILLPSGNLINSSTLFKCIDTQKSFGQLPADPFTGLLFDQTHYPVKHVPHKKLNKYLEESMHQKDRNNTKPSSNLNSVAQQSANSLAFPFLCDFCYCGRGVLYQISPCKHLICRECFYAKKETKTLTVSCLNNCKSVLNNRYIKRIYDIPIYLKKLEFLEEFLFI